MGCRVVVMVHMQRCSRRKSLTSRLLSQRNGGTFPFQRIYDIIDGTVMISAHGTKQMPIWGQVYTLKSEENYFTWRAFPWDDQPFVRARILALTEYVSRLQLKETDAK